MFFTSEQIDFAKNSSFAILASELSFVSDFAHAEVYADVPFRTTANNGQAFFILQVPGKAANLNVLNVFTQESMNQFNGTTEIIPSDSNRVSYIVIKVPKDNVTDSLSLHMKFEWRDFSSKISISQYTITASFDTTVPQFFDTIKTSLGINDQENILLPEAATTFRFSLARPSAERLAEIMPTADNIVFNGSNVWLLWDINRRSDSKRFVSTAVSLEAINESEQTLYDLSLTFFLFLIGLGIPLIISSSFEYSKSFQSFEGNSRIFKKPAFFLLLLSGITAVVFEALRFFSLLNLFGNQHNFFMLLLEIVFSIAFGFWLGEVGFASKWASEMVAVLIFFDCLLHFRLVLDFIFAGTIITLTFVLGELTYILHRRWRKPSVHIVEVYGSLLDPGEWNKLSVGGSRNEIGKEKRISWKLSFDKLSTRRKEAVLNLVHTANAQDVYYTTLVEVTDELYESLAQREMGKTAYTKWKKGEPIPDKNYRPLELDTHAGKATIFIIPEAGRILTPTTGESRYVKTVKKGIETLYQGEMKDVNLKALERAINESKMPNEE